MIVPGKRDEVIRRQHHSWEKAAQKAQQDGQGLAVRHGDGFNLGPGVKQVAVPSSSMLRTEQPARCGRLFLENLRWQAVSVQLNEGTLNHRDAMGAETDKSRPHQDMVLDDDCIQRPAPCSFLSVHRSAKGQNRAFWTRFSLRLFSPRSSRLCGSRGARILVAAALLQVSAVPGHMGRLDKHG